MRSTDSSSIIYVPSSSSRVDSSEYPAVTTRPVKSSSVSRPKVYSVFASAVSTVMPVSVFASASPSAPLPSSAGASEGSVSSAASAGASSVSAASSAAAAGCSAAGSSFLSSVISSSGAASSAAAGSVSSSELSSATASEAMVSSLACAVTMLLPIGDRTIVKVSSKLSSFFISRFLSRLCSLLLKCSSSRWTGFFSVFCSVYTPLSRSGHFLMFMPVFPVFLKSSSAPSSRKFLTCLLKGASLLLSLQVLMKQRFTPPPSGDRRKCTPGSAGCR